MYVLDKLWQGKLSPAEQCIQYGSEYSRLRKQMNAINEEDCYTNGFRIGVGLILDATRAYES